MNSLCYIFTFNLWLWTYLWCESFSTGVLLGSGDEDISAEKFCLSLGALSFISSTNQVFKVNFSAHYFLTMYKIQDWIPSSCRTQICIYVFLLLEALPHLGSKADGMLHGTSLAWWAQFHFSSHSCIEPSSQLPHSRTSVLSHMEHRECSLNSSIEYGSENATLR